MAVVVDALASQFAEAVGALVKDEIMKTIGAKEGLNQLSKKLLLLREVLVDAEQKAFFNPIIRTWLAELKDLIYDADDAIDYYRAQAERLVGLPSLEEPPYTCAVPCYPPLVSSFRRLALRHHIGGRIKSINFRLEEIIKAKNDFELVTTTRDDDLGSSRIRRQSDPLVEPDLVGVGIENDTRYLVDQLTRVGGPAVSALAIVGMGGLGKTTLAQKIYNHQTIKETFQMPPPLWVCVSKQYTDKSLLSQIIRLANPSAQSEGSVGELRLTLSQVIQGKKFFLILDDVWDARIWNDLLRTPLQSGAEGSRIFITTRSESVVKEMGVDARHIKPLSPQDGWSLIRKMVFKEGEEGDVQLLEPIGIQMVSKCQGLPLAIKTIAGVLRGKEKTKREWQGVLDNPAWSMNLPEGVMSVLYLSYEDLPFYLKQCFVFCSFFPEDYVFMRHTLIQLWVAEGFVEEKPGSIMEEVALGYYHELHERSLLQRNPRFYADGGCQMHDLLRSLALFLAQDEIFVGDATALKALADASSSSSSSSPSSSLMRLRHLLLANTFGEVFPDDVKKHGSLRTLIFTNVWLTGFLPDDIYEKLGRLRVLDLSYLPNKKLPESIGNLVHLRYLDLSASMLEELPETIGTLSNLQYLILQHCPALKSLPKGITRLYKLRSLDLLSTSVDGLPAGMGRLRHLNRLMGFKLNDSSNGNKTWCSLEELESLSELTALTIENLEKAIVRSKDGVSLLKDKTHIRRLGFSCKTDGQQYGEEEMKRIKEVFDGLLSPPDSVEKLKIEGYFALDYPIWMMDAGVAMLFSNLKKLDLTRCRNCRHLPPLGQLPHLDSLTVEEASAVESIGSEFMGWGGERVPRAALTYPAFPKLESLKLKRLPSWIEWLWEDVDEAAAMRRLERLRIEDCPNLRSLPRGIFRHATALTYLEVKRAYNMVAIEGLVSLKALVVKDNPNLVTISNLPALQNLQVISCPTLRDVVCLDSLQVLQLQDLKMESLPEWLLPRSGSEQLPFPMLGGLYVNVGSSEVLRRCLVDGPDWPKIRHFPHAYIQAQPTDDFWMEKMPDFVLHLRDASTVTTNLNAASGGGV